MAFWGIAILQIEAIKAILEVKGQGLIQPATNQLAMAWAISNANSSGTSDPQASFVIQFM